MIVVQGSCKFEKLWNHACEHDPRLKQQRRKLDREARKRAASVQGKLGTRVPDDRFHETKQIRLPGLHSEEPCVA